VRAGRETGTAGRPSGRNDDCLLECAERWALSRAFRYWLRKYGFADLEKRTRADLLRIMECLQQVEAWRAGLKDDDRLRFNHPTTICRRWSATKRGATPRRPSSTEQYREVRRLQEENDRLKAQLDRVLASAIDRAKLAKILGRLGSRHDGEVMNAARMAEDLRRQAGLSWEDLLGVT
jgi:hypothetical protein